MGAGQVSASQEAALVGPSCDAALLPLHGNLCSDGLDHDRVPHLADGTPERGCVVISSAHFRITEYAGPSIGQCDAIRPVYHSLPMCLRDASRYAAALSYARGAYVQVVADIPEETYQEWWFAGSIWKRANVPPIKGGGK